MQSVSFSPLGQKTTYISEYDASLLFPIARQESRDLLGLTDCLPFYGRDIWTGYELSWLNSQGKPQVAVAEFHIPYDSAFIIESKSFKLYLNSFNQTKFDSVVDVSECLVRDLSLIAGSNVDVFVELLHESSLIIAPTINGVCLDHLDVAINTYHPNTDFLNVLDGAPVQEILYSHLLKSNCPVTGQPDWASVFIEYRGQKMHHENLLRYIISFRQHQDFHEHCVERIFVDILQHCKPDFLSVYARYTRRGGLDINPFRCTDDGVIPCVTRLLRQ